MALLSRSHLRLLASAISVLILFTACQGQAVQPTPDISSAVAAQVEKALAGQAVPDHLPTHTPYPTLAPLPTHTPYPTYTPYPTPAPLPTVATEPEEPSESTAVNTGPFPTPVLSDADTLPVRDSEGMYDLGFGQLMFLKVPAQDTSGVFSPRPFRTIFVYPQDDGWADAPEWGVVYVRLQCAEFSDFEDHDAARSCLIID